MLFDTNSTLNFAYRILEKIRTFSYSNVWPILLVALALVFIYAWSGVSGWGRLCEKYPSPENFEGKLIGNILWPKTIVLGLWTLHQAFISVNQKGVRFSRLFHRSFYVPWEDISASEGRGFFGPVVELRLSKEPEIPVTIHKSVADEFAPYL